MLLITTVLTTVLTRDNINDFVTVIRKLWQVCAKFKELLISVIFVLLYRSIYLYSFCSAIKQHEKERLKSIQTLQEAYLNNE